MTKGTNEMTSDKSLERMDAIFDSFASLKQEEGLDDEQTYDMIGPLLALFFEQTNVEELLGYIRLTGVEPNDHPDMARYYISSWVGSGLIQISDFDSTDYYDVDYVLKGTEWSDQVEEIKQHALEFLKEYNLI